MRPTDSATRPRRPSTDGCGPGAGAAFPDLDLSPYADRPLADRVLLGRAHVIDGDTIVIRRTHVRLYGIDAPEIEDPFGAKAKWAMVALCKGVDVTAIAEHHDAYGRLVARCFLPDGTNLSEALVRQGLALDWPAFSGGAFGGFEPPGARKKLWRVHARQSRLVGSPKTVAATGRPAKAVGASCAARTTSDIRRPFDGRRG